MNVTVTAEQQLPAEGHAIYLGYYQLRQRAWESVETLVVIQ